MEQNSDSFQVQMISFKLDGYIFGINMLHVKAITQLTDNINLPDGPLFYDDNINAPGQLIPIVNLRTIFNLPLIKYYSGSKIIITEIKGKCFGFIVDEIIEILRIPMHLIDDNNDAANIFDSRFITASGKYQNQLVFLLNTSQLLPVELMAV